MAGHVGQNDTDFTQLQDELNAPSFRPLRPNFAIGPPFLTNVGGPTAPKRLGVEGRGRWGPIDLIDIFRNAHAIKGWRIKLGRYWG